MINPKPNFKRSDIERIRRPKTMSTIEQEQRIFHTPFCFSFFLQWPTDGVERAGCNETKRKSVNAKKKKRNQIRNEWIYLPSHGIFRHYWRRERYRSTVDKCKWGLAISDSNACDYRSQTKRQWSLECACENIADFIPNTTSKVKALNHSYSDI